jgi:hypothetical protein
MPESEVDGRVLSISCLRLSKTPTSMFLMMLIKSSCGLLETGLCISGEVLLVGNGLGGGNFFIN